MLNTRGREIPHNRVQLFYSRKFSAPCYHGSLMLAMISLSDHLKELVNIRI